jgi:copper chaperone CopZ
MPRSTLALACLLTFLLVPACGGDAPTETATGPEQPAKPANPAQPAKPEAPTVEATWRGAPGTLVFTAYDMSCSGCSSTVKSRLGALEGVEAVTADHETDVVEITLEEGADVEALKPLIVTALEQPESGKKFKLVQAAP